ncbi:mediator complex subunit MED14-domain-containing protein [Lentinula lateritia]|uniref:Mediator of RNA polymerase II transcription subunit 14 n=1 Tax=Lentinula lateritia TaxID=40482 RepID=A0ABQ8VYG7_9AGAR|nr:mediator complex subunit MED14-domain-containing protein [Lentinula lateritia]
MNSGPSTSDGMSVDKTPEKMDLYPIVNGVHLNGDVEPSIEQLERELPEVFDGQIPLGDILSRVMQAIYMELTEMSETLPNMSDAARKRTLADWVVKTKKQVVKLYAIVKWSRDADTVQKCMNITAFLMDQNRQFEDAIQGLTYARESLDPARLRNHDLLTSLDVLTFGTYKRLPTRIKKSIIPPTPLTDAEVIKTLIGIQDAIQFRLRLNEVAPVEMSRQRIANGRVYFTIPKLFECSLTLKGAQPKDSWSFSHVEFLINIGGDVNVTQEFPRRPTGLMHGFIKEEVDRQLELYTPKPPPDFLLPGVEPPPAAPELPEDVVDTPLIRLFNFLQMMSMSYQLEALFFQATRMRSLGWAEFLNVSITPNRKVLAVSYWIRKPPVVRLPPKLAVPLHGGTVTISMVEGVRASHTSSSKAKVLAQLQYTSKLGSRRPSDKVESLKFEVRWEPTPNAIGIHIPPEEYMLPTGMLLVDADNLDFEAMLRKIIHKHVNIILTRIQYQLQHTGRSGFAAPGVLTFIEDGEFQALKVLLCADKYILVSLDPRTGRFTLRDVGDLAATMHGLRLLRFADKINETPAQIFNALVSIRLHTIIDLIEQKAQYLGLQSFRSRNFAQTELAKLGPHRGSIYIQLESHPTHYLVIMISDEDFKYALINTQVVRTTITTSMVMGDIAWLDFSRLRNDDLTISVHVDRPDSRPVLKHRRSDEKVPPVEQPSAGFHLETQVLREIYSYCCARVAYMNVEIQFKTRGIPFTHVNHTASTSVSPELAYIQSSLARSVPGLCVQSSDILSGAPAAEAAMPNIRVIPLNWWSEKKAQVVTCVKLKYVQQPMGKSAGTSTVIRPSKRIIYDTTEAVVSFLSENVDTCVDEFLEEWARVSKMVVIARQVAQMSKEKMWPDVRLLSFDLQTVEFAYAEDYTVFITCEDQLFNGGIFDLRFSRTRPSPGSIEDYDSFNPHDDAEPYLRNILTPGHGRLAPSLHKLVRLLRDTLPIAVELEAIRRETERDQGQMPIDTFAKAAGWYRLMFGDLRHALDIRLMTDDRVAILDASYSFYPTVSSSNQGPVKTEEKDASGDIVMSEPAVSDHTLQSIPKYPNIVLDCVRQALDSGSAVPGKIAPVDVALICDKNSVKPLIRAVYTQVAAKLKQVS